MDAKTIEPERLIPPPRYKAQRWVYLDILRMASMFLVLVQHGVHYYFDEPESEGYIGRVLFHCVATIAVPVFFLISGATLLHKKESVSRVFKHRVLPFLLLVFICYIVQGGLAWVGDGAALRRLPAYILSAGGESRAWTPMYTKWFIRAYLAFLLMLPLVRVWARATPNRMFLFLIGLQVVVVGLLPALKILFSPNASAVLSINKHLPFFSDYWDLPHSNMAWLFYALVGYYLAHRVKLEQLTKCRLWLISGAAAVCFMMEAGLLEHVRLARHASSISEYRIPMGI